jgi:hypothetical protein
MYFAVEFAVVFVYVEGGAGSSGWELCGGEAF